MHTLIDVPRLKVHNINMKRGAYSPFIPSRYIKSFHISSPLQNKLFTKAEMIGEEMISYNAIWMG